MVNPLGMTRRAESPGAAREHNEPLLPTAGTPDAGKPALRIAAVEIALQISKPEIFNTDQGAQFTSTDFTGLLKKNGVKVSIDGRGRVFDNIFIERLWRSVKYEEVFLHEYQTVAEAKRGLGEYFRFYNEERLHEALGYRTPHELYFGTSALGLPTAV